MVQQHHMLKVLATKTAFLKIVLMLIWTLSTSDIALILLVTVFHNFAIFEFDIIFLI